MNELVALNTADLSMKDQHSTNTGQNSTYNHRTTNNGMSITTCNYNDSSTNGELKYLQL